jgi:uncharacterized phage protein (TIGR02218 family)
MGRSIPLALKDHLDSGVTTTCLLLRIDPVDPRFVSYGVTSLDRDVLYDNGSGLLRYVAAIGTEASALQGGSDLSVDNAEARSLLPEFDIPVSEADLRAGAYDFAGFSLDLVNWADLTQGHITLRAGSIGQIVIDDEGLSYVHELRGLSAALKQSVCERDSLTCRATFGSQPAGSPIDGPIERFPCGFDATSLLQAGAVTAMGLENTLTFTSSGTFTENSLKPGLVFWVTGLNAGRSNEVDTNTAAGVITLAHETDFPIQVGDELLSRPDCTKLARDEDKGCLHWFADEWVLHFRGEPDIPIGDAGAMETPGASSGPGMGGAVQIPFSSEAE